MCKEQNDVVVVPFIDEHWIVSRGALCKRLDELHAQHESASVLPMLCDVTSGHAPCIVRPERIGRLICSFVRSQLCDLLHIECCDSSNEHAHEHDVCLPMIVGWMLNYPIVYYNQDTSREAKNNLGMAALVVCRFASRSIAVSFSYPKSIELHVANAVQRWREDFERRALSCKLRFDYTQTEQTLDRVAM